MSNFDKRLEEELAKLEEEKKKKKKTSATSQSRRDLTSGIGSYLPSYDSPLHSIVSEMNRYTAPRETTSKLTRFDEDEDDIAPVRTVGSLSKKDDDEDDSGLDFFQKGTFEDGYQFGDVTKAILGTAGDIGLGAVKGFASLGEGVGDLINYGIAGVADATGNERFADRVRKRASENLVEKMAKGADDYLNQYSVLGRTSDSITQGIGQVGGILLTGGLGAAAGLGSAGATALTTGVMGLSGMGSGMGEAYQSGATDEEALMYGAISGAADALTELMFGGLGKAVKATGLSTGLSSADDMLAKKVSSLFSNHLAKTVTSYGIKAGAEGFEEVVAGTAQAIGKKITYMSEEELGEILEDENLLEQFVVGAFTSGLAQSGIVPGMSEGSLKESIQTGRDFITGFSQNEQAVIKKEIENRIAEQEKNGKKLTAKEKANIEAQVEKDMEKGYISTDTIEEVLGGETYKTYKATIDSEDALQQEFDTLNKMKQGDMTGEQIDRRAELKEKLAEIKEKSQRNQLKSQLGDEVFNLVQGDRLAESYNERSRRSQAFTADLTKYDEKQKAVIQKAVDSGILNNTNRTREFVDMVAKISADKGVLFDFTNNAKLKESGFAIDGKTVNGYVTKDGITINIQSSKSLNSLVGHEITHVLEGTDLYAELQNVVVEYAKTKGDYQGRYDSLTKLYEGIEGANIDAELTADLVGDYLFTDADFINNLSTNHRNVFQKIYDEVKYLLKVATAGSKEARELEKVKRAFDKAYRENGKTSTEISAEEINEADTKYSVSVTDKETIDFLENQEHITTYKAMQVIDGKLYPPMAAKVKDENGKYQLTNPSQIGVWQQATEDPTNIKKFKNGVGYYTLNKGNGKSLDAAYNPYEHSSNLVLNDQFEEAYNRPNIVTVECVIPASEMTSGYKAEHAKDGTGLLDWKSGVVAGKLKDNQRKVYLSRWLKPVRILSDAETASMYKDIVGDVSVPFNVVPPGLLTELEKIGVNIDYEGSPNYKSHQRRKSEKAKQKAEAKYSLSAEQQEYFKDSVVRDETGELKVMYHGTSKGGHTVFDTYGRNYGLFGQGSYFTDNKDIAQSYTKKGKGKNPQVYEAYLNIKNPIDMDAAADPAAWAKAFPDASFPTAGTNEDFYRAMEEYFEDNEYSRWEAAEVAMDALMGMGYDGITHIGGGRVNPDGVRHQVYIAFEPEQIKNIDNAKPTTDPDIRYSLSDSDGNQLSQEQAEYFKDSKARDSEGRLIPVYHGTFNDFHVFDIGKTSPINDLGKGHYFTSNPADANANYASRTGGDVQTKIEDEAYGIFIEMGFTEDDLYDNDHVEDYNKAYDEAEKRFFSSPRVIKSYLNIKNPLYVEKNGIFDSNGEKIFNHFNDFEAEVKEWGVDLKELGYDGIIDHTVSEKFPMQKLPEGTTHFVVFDSQQIKAVANRKPTGNPDIRYSLSDSTGKELTKEQQDYFRNSKVRDENGSLMVMYHGTPNGDFTVFKDGTYFTDNKEYADRYQNPGASSISTGKTASNPKTFEVYLNIQKPFDLADAEARRIYIEDYIKGGNALGINPYLSDAEYAKIDTIDWTEGEDLRDFLTENGYDYDGLVLDEGGTGGYGDAVQSRGKSYVIFSPEQVKAVDNRKPTADKDIRFSLSDESYLDAVNRGDMAAAQQMVNAAAKAKGYTDDNSWKMQHSAPNAKDDVSLVALKESGLVPSDYWDHPEWYTYSPEERESFYKVKKAIELQEKWTAEGNPRDAKIWVYRAVDKTKNVREDFFRNGDWVTPSYDYAVNEGMMNPNGYRIIKWPVPIKDLYWDGNSIAELGYDDGKSYAYADTKNNRKLLDPVTYDNSGNVIPLSKRFNKRDIDPRYSLSAEGEEAPVYGSYNVYGKDVALETAPVQEEAAPVAETTVKTKPAISQTKVEDLFPDDLAPVEQELEFLMAERDDLQGAMDAYASVGDVEAVNGLLPEFEAVNEKIKALQQEDSQRVGSLGDDNVPPEMEAPYPGEANEPMETPDPFAERDMREVGSQKVKAYMYENPEVKPFFQEEALGMLGDLHNGTRGEKIFNEQLHYDSGGEQGWMGTKRNTTADIAELLDQWHYTYAEIEKGLNAIIEDNGAENNAVSKRIEFMLHDRLVNGYTGVWGEPMPANQEYINLLKEKQINEYSQEAFERFMATADRYAPAEDIAPVANAVVTKPSNVPKANNTQAAVQNDIAPTFEVNGKKGVPDGQQAFMPIEETPKKVTRKSLHEGIIGNVKTLFKNKGFDFDKVLQKAKNLSTFATVDNTPQRVLEKALGYKEGQLLSEVTVNRVARNETDGIRWLNSFTDKKNGLIPQISRQYNIKPGSKESAAAQMYAEGFYVGENDAIIQYGDRELAMDFPNAKVRENIKRLARDPRIRRIYDETLAAINASRTRNAYPEIPRLDNYFLHFRAMEDTFSRLGLPFNPNDIRAKDLPTDLNGVTADLKPGQPYFASAMHRKGKRTSFDLLGGLEKYLTSAKNQIYHIDDIQTLRALRNYIAETYGQASGLENLDTLSEEEAELRIKQVYNSHLSTFAKFLNEEANILAGKTALIDRGLEGIIGRRGITFLNTLNKQVGSNMVGFNVSSSLTNFLAPVQALAKTNKFDFVKAMAQTASNRLASIVGKGDNFTEESPVMIRRKGAERFYRTPYQKVADAGYVLMGVVDDLSTELIARTKYNEFVRKGMSSNKAHYESDKWVSRLMGDRSLGQQPQLYNSQMLGMITKFQLEVRNQLDSQFYDTIQEAKASTEHIQNGLLRNAKKAAKVTSTFVQLAALQHLFGKAFESVAGYNPAFDIVDVLIKTFGWDDEEDDEDTVLDNIEEGFLTLLEDLPYTSTLTGGRIPISSALPVAELIKGEDQYGNEKSRWETIGEVAPYYVLPGGYGQIKKTAAGMKMFDEDHPIAGSYTDSGSLRFPVEDNLRNRVQAGLFGQWASDVARDYFDNERKPLNEKQTQELIDVDLPIRDYWEYRDGLSGLDKVEDKIKYIEGLDLPVYKKNILVNNVTDRKKPIDLTDYDQYSSYDEWEFASKNPEKYGFLQENGISYSEYTGFDEDTKEWYDGVYNWQKEYPDKVTVSKAVTDSVVEYRKYASDLDDIRADKDSRGKSISGSAKAKKWDYIMGLDMDYGSKLILFKNEYNADDTYNYEIIDYLNSREDISFDEMNTICRELGFTVYPDGTITWD